MSKNGELIDFVKEPKWFLDMKSKVNTRNDRSLFGFLIPLFISPILSGIIMYFLFINISISDPYNSFISVIIIMSMFVIFYYITRKYYILKDAEYDRFELYGYICGKIGIDLERLLLLPNYNHYIVPNINALRFNGWVIRRKNYKTEDEKIFRKSLISLPKLSFKLIDVVENVDENREIIEKLSRGYLSIGYHISKNIKPRINPYLISETVKLLEGIEEVKISQQIKSILKSKVTIFIAFTMICSTAGGIITYHLTSDIGTTILAFLGILAAIPTLYIAVKSLSS